MIIQRLIMIISPLMCSLLFVGCHESSFGRTTIELGDGCSLAVQPQHDQLHSVGARFRVSGNCAGVRIDFYANIIEVGNRELAKAFSTYDTCYDNPNLYQLTSRGFFKSVLRTLMVNDECDVQALHALSLIKELLDTNQIQILREQRDPYTESMYTEDQRKFFRFHSENASSIVFARFLDWQQRERFLCVYSPVGFDGEATENLPDTSIERGAAQCAVEHLSTEFRHRSAAGILDYL